MVVVWIADVSATRAAARDPDVGGCAGSLLVAFESEGALVLWKSIRRVVGLRR